MKLNIKHIFIIIITLATIVRFVGLGSFSPPLNRDEAAIGYNAYSLLQTGHDEHGEPWPISFKSIGDYKMPGYIYATIIPVSILGLNEFSIRFWSAIGGVFAVVSIWYLCKELMLLLAEKKTNNSSFSEKYFQYFPAVASLLLAINPWHIHYSRIGFEANLTLTLFLWAITFFLISFRKNWLIIPSAILFVATLFTYSSVFIVYPFFFISIFYLFFIYRKKYTNFFIPIVSIFILLAGSFWIGYGVLQVSLAKQAITIFSDPSIIDIYNHELTKATITNPIWAKVWMNKYSYFGRMIFVNYLKNFSPGFLFFNRINHPWHGISKHGYFYFTDFAFLIIGLIQLIKLFIDSIKKKNQKQQSIYLLIFSCLLTPPLASAITVDAPHATRSLHILPIIIIIITLGIFTTWQYFHTKFRLKSKLFNSTISIIYLIHFIILLYSYFIFFPKHYSQSLYSGVKAPIQYVSQHDSNRNVYMSNVSDSLYLYVLIYGEIDPIEVQQQAIWKQADTAGLVHIEQIGKYYFHDGIGEAKPNSYWILKQSNAPADFVLDKEFEDKRTQQKWYIYKN